MSHVTRNAKRGSLGEFRTFRDREGRARQECDFFWTKVLGWTKVILFHLGYVYVYTYVYTYVYVVLPEVSCYSIFESALFSKVHVHVL